jgi:hypothetical protein
LESSLRVSERVPEEDLIRLSKTFLETSASVPKSTVLLFSASKSSSAASVSSRSLLVSALLAISSSEIREITIL